MQEVIKERVLALAALCAAQRSHGQQISSAHLPGEHDLPPKVTLQLFLTCGSRCRTERLDSDGESTKCCHLADNNVPQVSVSPSDNGMC